MKKVFIVALALFTFFACKKDKKTEEPTPDPTPVSTCPPASCTTPDSVWTPTGTGPRLVFKFKFDSTQIRLNNLGQPSTIPAANAAFSPIFRKMSAHYIEMAQNDLTAVGAGKVLYKAPETGTNCAGANAITFCQSVVVKEGDIFFSIPIASVTPGSYKWLRVSLAYQNYDIAFKTGSCSGTQWGTIASFLGFNTYVTEYKIKNKTFAPTASVGGPGNHKQGYWGFESKVCGFYDYFGDGQPPAGATTVVNPNSINSPIPAGSCLVTGEFYNGSSLSPLIITGSETSDIIITVSLSTNKSFEWKEVTFDGYFQPEAGESPVDMGVRGMIPKY